MSANNALPDGVIEALAEGRQDSCALDEAEKFANEPPIPGHTAKRDVRPFEEIAALLPKPKKQRQGKRTDRAELTKERVRQIADRGLNKQWAALSFIKAYDDFHAEFTNAGGRVDFLWGVIVTDEGDQLVRRNDTKHVWITIGLDCSALERPHRVEGTSGVFRRRKSASTI